MGRAVGTLALLVHVACVMAACDDRPPSGEGAEIDREQAAERARLYTHDDARWSEAAREAIRVATEAVEARTSGKWEWDARYRVEGTAEDGFRVTVWRVVGYENGEPQFVPGGHHFVEIDEDGEVVRMRPGA